MRMLHKKTWNGHRTLIMHLKSETVLVFLVFSCLVIYGVVIHRDSKRNEQLITSMMDKEQVCWFLVND
jgi:hypothetical protein